MTEQEKAQAERAHTAFNSVDVEQLARYAVAAARTSMASDMTPDPVDVEQMAEAKRG